jgi:hypothetical protein
MRRPLAPIPNPGAAATVIMFDDGAKEGLPQKGQPTEALWYRLSLFADQVVNIEQMNAPPGSATLRRVGALEPTDGATIETYERKLWPGRNVFRVVTTTGPGTWEMGHETSDQAA